MKMSLLKLLILFLGLMGVTVVQGQDEQPLGEVPGRVAYVGSDYNIYTMSLDHEDTIMLTEDGSFGHRYQWPTWSTDGRLAYFCCENSASGDFKTEVYVSEDGINPSEQIYAGENQVFTYAYWAPTNNCDLGDDCRDLAVLLSRIENGQFSIELFHHSSDESSNDTVGFGAPLYFSWSPNAIEMLLLRNNARFDIYETESNGFERLRETPGNIQAPSWSPVDDRLLLGVRSRVDRRKTDLILLANGESQILQQGLSGLVSYNWSPDGNYIAYRTADAETLSPLYVLDAITGEVVSQTNTEDVFAFFWSPNSRHIAFVTLATPRGSFNVNNSESIRVSNPSQSADGIAWAVLDIENGQTRLYSTFTPTQEMIYMFSFFDQFAQSHQIWSPDSTHIVFGEVKPGGESAVSILDMTRSDTVPFFAAEGSLGVWSFR